MSGTINGKRWTAIKAMTVAAAAAAVFALLYYSGVFLPGFASWHEVVISAETEDEPDEIVLKNRRLSAYKDGECIFKTPLLCRVQNAIFTDIDRDGMKELILLNFNIGRYGDHRPFWVRFDPPVFRQHIYIYDYDPARELFRPIWMASDIGMEASDMEKDIEKDMGMEASEIEAGKSMGTKASDTKTEKDMEKATSGAKKRPGDKQVLILTDRHGMQTRWMWISFGLRCVD